MATLRYDGASDYKIKLIDKPSFTIGRHGDFKTPSHHLSVSRLHCAVLMQGELSGHTIRDLNSYSGTVVNGDLIGTKERKLSDGDKISLGNHVVLVYRRGKIG